MLDTLYITLANLLGLKCMGSNDLLGLSLKRLQAFLFFLQSIEVLGFPCAQWIVLKNLPSLVI